MSAAVATLALPLSYALGLLEPGAVPGRIEHGPELLRRAAGCFVYGSLHALPFLGLAWLLERSDRLPSGTALYAGAASGLVANLVLLVHCPLNDRQHLLLGHASIGFALTLLLVLASRVQAKASRT